jgi:hypothetical protein
MIPVPARTTPTGRRPHLPSSHAVPSGIAAADAGCGRHPSEMPVVGVPALTPERPRGPFGTLWQVFADRFDPFARRGESARCDSHGGGSDRGVERRDEADSDAGPGVLSPMAEGRERLARRRELLARVLSERLATRTREPYELQRQTGPALRPVQPGVRGSRGTILDVIA